MKKYISMVLILILVATTLVGCGGSKLTDCTYTGEGTGMKPGLKVSVVVADGKISTVEVTEHNETEGYSEPALEQIPGAIEEKNSTDVDAVSGATLTSNAIKEAVNQALEGAK